MSSDHLPRALQFANERAERWKVRYDELLARLPEAKADAWDEGHKAHQRRGPDDCHCGAYYDGECACGYYGSGELVSLKNNPYRD